MRLLGILKDARDRPNLVLTVLNLAYHFGQLIHRTQSSESELFDSAFNGSSFKGSEGSFKGSEGRISESPSVMSLESELLIKGT